MAGIAGIVDGEGIGRGIWRQVGEDEFESAGGCYRHWGKDVVVLVSDGDAAGEGDGGGGIGFESAGEGDGLAEGSGGFDGGLGEDARGLGDSLRELKGC